MRRERRGSPSRQKNSHHDQNFHLRISRGTLIRASPTARPALPPYGLLAGRPGDGPMGGRGMMASCAAGAYTAKRGDLEGESQTLSAAIRSLPLPLTRSPLLPTHSDISPCTRLEARPNVRAVIPLSMLQSRCVYLCSLISSLPTAVARLDHGPWTQGALLAPFRSLAANALVVVP